jgi:methyl halide transferase
MASLVKPGGYIITLVFPILPETDLGPPYFVRVEHYAEVLDKNFIKVMDKEPGTSEDTHVGRERMVVWRRRVLE